MTETNAYSYLEYAAMSDMGRVRGNNEDSFLCAPEAGCFAVADGMGGGDAGEVASATVVECLKKAVESTALDSPGCRKYAIQQSLHKANGTVVKYRDSHGFKSMGSTVVMLVLNPWKADEPFVCHVGDSRLYCFRDGEMFCITRDHSVGNEMKSKGIKEVLPDKMAKALTRVIGGSGLLVPEWQKIAMCPNDLFLICSDGILVLPDEEIEQVMKEKKEPQTIVDELKTRVLAAGAPDNLTAICIRAANELPLAEEVDKYDREESDLLLKVAEERKDYGAN
ncbi:MAG: serine/threonine-protein phosphatase [Victivallales bacterium]|nr:serine/threonine-protein phosphatase [Victivallales bacterium]